MWVSDEFIQKTDWIAQFGDIKNIEFVRVFPDEQVARFKITYWDAQDDSAYGRGGGLMYEFVDFPYDIFWDSDDDGDFCSIDDVELGSLRDVLTSDQIDYIFNEIGEAVC